MEVSYIAGCIDELGGNVLVADEQEEKKKKKR